VSAGKRPLYFRLLRVRHLKARPWVVFLLFEGSIGLAILLALAEIVNLWGLLAIPVAVAAMVKVNDVITGAMLEPLAHAQLRTPRIVPLRVTGYSAVPRTGRFTIRIDDDDAVADPAARPDGVARGVARPRILDAPARRPQPGARDPEPPMPEHAPIETLAPPARSDGANRRRGNQGRFA
jgi:hypothetical protein